MIRIGSVSDSAYDARAEAGSPPVPRPRAAVEITSASRPPAR